MAEIINLAQAKQHHLLKNSHCVMGAFDGVHIGHQYLILQTSWAQARCYGPRIVITFDKDPDELFANHNYKKLMTNEERLKTLSSCHTDYILPLKFDYDFAAQSPDEFLNSVFDGDYPLSIHVGSNFRYGHKAQGDIQHLKEWGTVHRVAVTAYPLMQSKAEPVSSTRIRALLSTGSVELANTLLSRPYTLSDVVLQSAYAESTTIHSISLSPERDLLAPGTYHACLNICNKSLQVDVIIPLSDDSSLPPHSYLIECPDAPLLATGTDCSLAFQKRM